MTRRNLGRLLVVGGSAALLIALPAAPTFAAGSGYGPSVPPPAVASAGFTSIVTAQTITSSGGTVTGSSNGGTCTVTVPSGSFPNGGEVVISAGTPSSVDAGSGNTVVIDFSVSVIDPNTGADVSGPFSPPITVTITYSGISSGDTVEDVSAPGVASAIAGAQVTPGEVVVSLSSDSNLAVIATTTSTAAVTAAAGALAYTGLGPDFRVLGLIGLVISFLGFLSLFALRLSELTRRDLSE